MWPDPEAGLDPPEAMVAAVHAAVVASTSSPSAAAQAAAARAAPLASRSDVARLADAALARVHGLGPLEPLLADPSVTEVMVNAGTEVWVERGGVLRRSSVTLPPGWAERIVERVIAPLGLRADRTSPVVDARLPDGSRLSAVLPPLSPDGTTICIRRFSRTPLGLEAFGAAPVVERLRAVVAEQRNVLVTGATSSGKTSLLMALLAAVAPGQRIVTIEDAAELQVAAAHVVRLEARPATADGIGRADLRTLLRAALRLRPDRLVVGEVRGPEALDLVQALSTGHDGSLGTLHATSPPDALRRLEALVLAAQPGLPLEAVQLLVHGALDLVVHVERGVEGRRRVAAMVELAAPEELADGRPRWRDVLTAPFERPARVAS